MKFFGLDKVAKLANIVKQHGGLRASLYHLYRTDDLKVTLKTILDSLYSCFLPRLEDLLEKTNMATNIIRMTNISTAETDGSSTIPNMVLTMTAAWFLQNGNIYQEDNLYKDDNDIVSQVRLVALQD